MLRGLRAHGKRVGKKASKRSKRTWGRTKPTAPRTGRKQTRKPTYVFNKEKYRWEKPKRKGRRGRKKPVVKVKRGFFHEMAVRRKAKRALRKIENLGEFEEQYNSLAAAIKSVEVVPLKIKVGDLTLDVKQTMGALEKRSKSVSETNKALTDIIDTAKKYDEYLKGVNYRGRRSLLLADILFNTRDSIKFQAQMDSAYSRGYTKYREELFILTVAEGLAQPGINIDAVLGKLNPLLREAGYPLIRKGLILKYMGKYNV